jgi:tetratricopeptide (TPR) repeat protein
MAALRPAEAAAATSGHAVAPAQLPFGVGGFTGRADELRQLDHLLHQRRSGSPAPVVISAIAGTAGVGKTALAVHWAYQVRQGFTDGQLYADLRGFTPGAEPLRPLQALAWFLQALGVPNDQVPTDVDAAACLYRTLVADRRMLVLLDNARDPAQVRPLLPGGTGSLVVVTSRDQMDGLLAREGASRITLGAFAPAEALSMLECILGRRRVRAEPEASDELARLCARLPLALRIAATNLHGQPQTSVRAYTARLRTDLLSELAVAGDPMSVVRVAFEASYLALPPAARRLFRRLGMVPGPDIALETAAAIADLDTEEVSTMLNLLTGSHLVQQNTPGRFACHDLLRLYARERAAAEDGEHGIQRIVQRVYDHYLAKVGAAATILYPQLVRLPVRVATDPDVADSAAAVAWLDSERGNLVAAVTTAAQHGLPAAAWQLADGMRGYFGQRMVTVDWLACARAGLAAADAAADISGQAACQLSLATLRYRLGDLDQAIGGYTRALSLAQQAGWVDGAVSARGNLSNAYWRLGRTGLAATHLAEVLTHARRTGPSAGLANVLANLGAMSFELGLLRLAADQQEEALAVSRQVALTVIEARCLANLGETYLALGHLDRVEERLTQALALHRRIGDQDSESYALCLLAALDRDRGNLSEALRLAGEALRFAQGAGYRQREAEAYDTLGTIHSHLGNPRVAAEYHRKALELVRVPGYQYTAAMALLGLAEASNQLGDENAALAVLEEVLEIARSSGYRVPEGRAYTQMALLHLRARRPDAAIRAAIQAAAIHEGTGHRLGQAHAHAALAEALRSTGRTAEARAHRPPLAPRPAATPRRTSA